MGDAIAFPLPWSVRPLSAAQVLFEVADARGNPVITLLPRAIADQVAAAPTAAALLERVREEVARLVKFTAQGLLPDEADPLTQVHCDLVALQELLRGAP